MIVDSMTHDEVFKELDKDRDNVTRWFIHRADEYRRRALKVTKFPVTWWLDYTSPRKNRYIISVRCIRRDYRRFHGLTVVALRRDGRGFSVYLSYIGTHVFIRKMIFVQHVFDRYAERISINAEGLDIVRHFVDNQTNGTIINDHQLAGRSVRYNGRDHQFVAVKDGVLLGDVENGIFIARTFITYEMATGKQREAFCDAKNDVNELEKEIVLVRNSTISKRNHLINIKS